jgi:hypothetical protein
MEKISNEESQKYVPYTRTPLSPNPAFYTIEVDSDGWETVKYFTRRLRQSSQGGKGDQFVYVLQNDSMPGMLKIGYTKNEVDIRAEQLSKPTGIPTPFNVVYTYSCFNGERIEKEVHKELAKKRVWDKREFFHITLEEAEKLIKQMGEKYD